MDKPPSKITPIPQVKSKYFYVGPVRTFVLLAVVFAVISVSLVGDWRNGQLDFWEKALVIYSFLFIIVVFFRLVVPELFAAGIAIRIRVVGIPAIAKLEWKDVDIREVPFGGLIRRTVRFRYFDDKGQKFFATQTCLPGHLAETLLKLPPGTACIPVLYDPRSKRAIIDWRRWIRESPTSS